MLANTIVTYASAVWWNGKRWQEQSVEKVQNAALRLICACFKTTPLAAMQVEAGLMPVRMRLDRNRGPGQVPWAPPRPCTPPARTDVEAFAGSP